MKWHLFFLREYWGKRLIRAFCRFVDIRQFSDSKHHRVDSPPFGCRTGMLLKIDVLYRAITSIENYTDYRLLYTCPKGAVFNQGKAFDYAKASKGLILISGYYEGIDDRLFDIFDIERVSLGEFVLSSGDIASLAISEATARGISGVLGNPDSLGQDSIIGGFLEYPQYTLPRAFKQLTVPPVVVSGHHEELKKWQRKASLKQTLLERPEYLADKLLTESDSRTILEIVKEVAQNG